MSGPGAGGFAGDSRAAFREPVRRRGTRGFVVNRLRARTLAGMYPDFDEIDVRETLENFPVKGAINLLIWATEKSPDNPYKTLRNWARKNGKGHYAKAMLRKPSTRVYREYMAALEEERSRLESETGRETLTELEIERVTREVYAPRNRAELSRISEASWRSFHEELEKDARAA